MFSSNQQEQTKQPQKPVLIFARGSSLDVILLFLFLMDRVHFSGAGSGGRAEPPLASPQSHGQGHATLGLHQGFRRALLVI